MAEPAAPCDFERHVRRVAPDRWLAARLIPAQSARTEVLALYALDDELGRIAAAVSQPMLGEIRLQWWRDALERAADGGAPDHPAVEALAPALRGGRLRRDLLETLVRAHEADLDPAPFPDEARMVAWFDAAYGSVMGMAARLLDPAAVECGAFVHAARAWGWSVQLRTEPAWRARGREPWPPGWGDDPAETMSRVRSRVEAALKAAKPELKPLPTVAFPAVAYATLALARACAKDHAPSELSRRARLLWAAARGAL